MPQPHSRNKGYEGDQQRFPDTHGGNFDEYEDYGRHMADSMENL